MLRHIAVLGMILLPVSASASDSSEIHIEAVDHALYLLDSAGTNFVTLQAPSSMSANTTLTFPSTNGSSGQMLSTDGAGNLSWSSVPTVVPGTSAGVVPAAGLPAAPAGVAVGSGYVGEIQSSTPSLSNTSCAANADCNNNNIATIPAGNWWMSVLIHVYNPNGITGLEGGLYMSGTVGSGNYVYMTSQWAPGRDGFVVSVPQLVSLSSSTQISVTVHPVAQAVTLGASASYIQLVRAF